MIVADAGDDLIDGRGGNDLVCAGAGEDIVLGGNGSDRIFGSEGSDLLLGGRGSDRLSGGGGLDLLLGEAGRDSIAGGSGLDLATYLTSPSGVRVNLGAGTARGNGLDHLIGIEGAIGSNFHDLLIGGRGTNYFDGGPGNDVLQGGRGIDVAFFLTSKFRVRVDLHTGSARGSGLDRLVGIEAVVGSEHDDALTGNRRPNELIGGPGSDRIGGGGGGDLCFGEAFQSCESANYEDPPALNSSLPSSPERSGPPMPPSAPGPSPAP